MGKNTLDHHAAFEVLFQQYPVSKFLEFGLGAGTQFFLDRCSHVTSIELAWSNDRKWFNRCQTGYRNYQNWDAQFFMLPETICAAEKDIRADKGNAVYHAAQLWEKDLEAVVKQFVRIDTYDLVFVDPGTHLRADIVNFLFDRGIFAVCCCRRSWSTRRDVGIGIRNS